MFGLKNGRAGTKTVTESDVLAALGRIQDPDLRRDIVSLGFVKDLQIQRGRVSFKIELTTPACPVKGELERQARSFVSALPGVEQVDVTMTSSVRSMAAPPGLSQALPSVRNVIAVGSGKGGVGKSTVTVNLAVALAQTGARVGVLDADIYGPSVPGLLGTRERLLARMLDDGREAMAPLEAHGVRFVSIGLLPPLVDNPTEPAVLRGPMVGSAIKTLLGDTDWGPLDYLLVDMPPGTGDATLTLAQSIPLSGAVIVTQPQDVALGISVKALRAFQKLNVPILGMVENMSYFICDTCGTRHDIFSHGGARRAAEEYKVHFSVRSHSRQTFEKAATPVRRWSP